MDVTKLQFLDNPGLEALRAAFQIREGRLFVQPFDVKLGGTTMTVSGSNGLDQSLQYTLGLRVPRSLMGGGANQAIAGLVSKAGAAGIDLSAAPEIPLGIQLAGTVTNPSVKVDVGSVASSVKEGVQQAVQQAATQKVSAEATKLVQEAEQRAASIRKEAQALADKVKLEGYQQADSLTAKSDESVPQGSPPSPPPISFGSSRTTRPRASSARPTSGRTVWSPRPGGRRTRLRVRSRRLGREARGLEGFFAGRWPLVGSCVSRANSQSSHPERREGGTRQGMPPSLRSG